MGPSLSRAATAGGKADHGCRGARHAAGQIPSRMRRSIQVTLASKLTSAFVPLREERKRFPLPLAGPEFPRFDRTGHIALPRQFGLDLRVDVFELSIAVAML
jgi:hypothetical protein